MIVELPDRVLELRAVKVAPTDRPGISRHRLTVEVLSGEGLTEEDWGRVIAELVGNGFDVVSWGGR